MSYRFIPALVAACATAVAGSAVADPAHPFGALSVVSATVRLADVDMHTAKGAKTAALRIKNAASFVCSGGNDIIYQMADDYVPCRQRTIDRALLDLNEPLVSAALGRSIDLAQR